MFVGMGWDLDCVESLFARAGQQGATQQAARRQATEGAGKAGKG